jgi:hypothetical protein
MTNCDRRHRGLPAQHAPRAGSKQVVAPAGL